MSAFKRGRKLGGVQVRQESVADITRRFADALDDERCRLLLATTPGARRNLTALLDALGMYAAGLGENLVSVGRFVVFWPMPPKRCMTDELRRFADALERRADLVRMVDPEYKRLASAVKAMSMFAAKLGIDLGLGRCDGVIVQEPVNRGRG